MALSERRDERGAVIPMVALLLVVILGVTALAVDLGMQRVARRDMQALADGVALDLSRLIDGRTASAIAAGSAGAQPLSTVLASSVARNNTATLGDPPAVRAILVNLDAQGAPVLDASGQVVEVTGAGVPAAIYVTASTRLDFVFATGSGGAGRSAVGVSQSNACFRLGSFAAGITPSNAPILKGFLNDSLDVNAVGYDGLANATVSLGGLATQLGVGTVEELADLEHVSLSRLLLASARALEGRGELADITLLNSLAASVESSLQIDIADVLDLSTAGSSALSTTFNVLDLVAGAAFVANGDNFLDLPVLWNVPQFSNGAVSLQVIARPQGACGRPGAQAATAQVRLKATPTLNVPTIAGLAAASTVVDLDVSLASAVGTLVSATCGAGTVASPQSITVKVDRQLSTINLAITVHLTGEIKSSDIILNDLLFGILNLLGVKAKVDLYVDFGVKVTTPPTSSVVTYSVPPRTWDDAEHVGGNGNVVLPTVSLTSSRFTGTVKAGLVSKDLINLNIGTDIKLDPIISDLINKNVLSGVNQFIGNVNAQLTPLTQLLGIQTGGADLFGVAPPTCNNPSLAG